MSFFAPRFLDIPGLPPINEFDINIKIVYSDPIQNWVRKMKDWIPHQWPTEELKPVGNDNQTVSLWINEITGNEEILRRWIGKTAINIWLYEQMENYTQIGRIFQLGLKYYLARPNKHLLREEEIELLTNIDFHDMTIW